MLIPNLKNKLNLYATKGLSRERFIVKACDEAYIRIANKKPLINFSSNDYLGMRNHPEVIKAFIQAAQTYGVGSGASALVSGFYRPHYLLEEKMAEFLKRDRAILFNSGYHANLGVMSALATRNSLIISDKYCHASLIDGIRLSGAKHLRFKHNNVMHAESLIARAAARSSFLVTESVFSAEGNISPINQLVALTKRFHSTLIVDDAHGIGVLGKNGGGILEFLNLSQRDVPCLITPLGKAFGAMGAIVSGDSILIECLIQMARTYCYTIALPPAIASAALVALQLINKENWRREKLNSLIAYFIDHAKESNLSLVSEDLTPIKGIIIGNNNAAIKITEKVKEQGFLISCLRPPTVPHGTARLRIMLNCSHEEKDIDHLLMAIAESYEKFT